MGLVYVSKGLGVLGAAAVADLWTQGDCYVGTLLVASLLTMVLATRQYARRRAREGGRS